MTDREIIQLLMDTGHLCHPFGKYVGEVPKEYASETPLSDPRFERALASYQDFMSECLDPLCITHHGRSARADGISGPATRELLELPRCGCPDYGEEVHAADVSAAVGTGSWKRCHDVGDFHAANAYIDDKYMPAFLKSVWDEVWERSAAAYAEIGLRWTRVENKSEANTIVSFERGRKSWIGLAIVGQNESCTSRIWAQFLASYNPSDTVAMWTELVLHELGHNASLQHSRGGIMNPSIMRGLAPTWKGDPSESILKRYYGGEPITPPAPDPPVPPTPPSPGPKDFPLGIVGNIITVKHPDGTVTEGDISFRAVHVPVPE